MKSKNIPNKVLLVTSMIFFCFISTNVFGQVDENIKKAFDVGPGGLLTIETDLGAIEVTTAGEDSVGVGITFRLKRGSRKRINDLLKDYDIDFRHRGNDVTVIVEHKKSRWNFWNSVAKHLDIKFLVTVPKKYNLDLKTAGGSISIADLEGEVRSSTSGGRLTFGRIKGSVFGRTSGGGVTLEGCEGNMNVKTSGGSMRIGKVTGDITAHTSGGNIDVDEVMGSINAKTSGGSITVRISQQPQDSCVLSTSGGSITAYLAQAIKVNLDARTSGGRVKTDFPVSAIIKGEINNHSLRGTINGGGPDLYLHTSGGNIYIKGRI